MNDAEPDRVQRILDAYPVRGARDFAGRWRLDEASQRRLEVLGAKIAPQMPSTPPVPIGIELWDGPGAQSIQSEVVERLSAAAPNSLRVHGWENRPGEVSFVTDPRYRNERLPSNTMAHEFGHMLGLGDEYGDAGPEGHGVGQEQRDLTEASGAEQHRVDADTTSVMSCVEDVLLAHYVTLWEALTRMTRAYLNPSDWRL